MCAVDGCRQATYYVDHVVPVLDWIAQGGNPVDPANCQPLCYKHGNEKTGREGKAKSMGKIYNRGIDNKDTHRGEVKD